MSESRDAILATLRRQLKRGPLEGERRAALEARFQQPPRHTIPQRSRLPHAEQVALFISMAEQAAATVHRLPAMETVPAAVADYVLRNNLPGDLVLAPDPAFAELPWAAQQRLKIERRAARGDDKVCVSPAFAGIAETGTLMLLSGPHSPTTLNFLPDAHIVVLSAEHIVGPYEDAWQRLREQDKGMPRTVNLITGPSRSADIEQTLQLGAHGPIELHILVVDS